MMSEIPDLAVRSDPGNLRHIYSLPEYSNSLYDDVLCGTKPTASSSANSYASYSTEQIIFKHRNNQSTESYEVKNLQTIAQNFLENGTALLREIAEISANNMRSTAIEDKFFSEKKARIAEAQIKEKVREERSFLDLRNRVEFLENKIRTMESSQVLKCKCSCCEHKVPKENDRSTKTRSKANEKQHLSPEEAEKIVLRLASLGEEKIYHVEVVGTGKRRVDGSAIRRFVLEQDFSECNSGDPDTLNLKLKAPRRWKSFSDCGTINSNFKQVKVMFNEVVLKRMDQIEEKVEKSFDQVHQKLDVLQKLVSIIARQQNKLDGGKEEKVEEITAVNKETQTSIKTAAKENEAEDSSLKSKNFDANKKFSKLNKNRRNYINLSSTVATNQRDNVSSTEAIEENKSADAEAVKELIESVDKCSSKLKLQEKGKSKGIGEKQPSAQAGRAAFIRAKNKNKKKQKEG